MFSQPLLFLAKHGMWGPINLKGLLNCKDEVQFLFSYIPFSVLPGCITVHRAPLLRGGRQSHLWADFAVRKMQELRLNAEPHSEKSMF